MKQATPKRITGKYFTISTVAEPVKAFVPAPLPPSPPLVWSARLQDAHTRALHALGRLDAFSTLLPGAALVLYSFVRKEAVLSSMIEGTQSSLEDLLLFELDEQPGVPIEDAREVSRCVAALEHGLKRIREGFPLSLRLIREVHGVLLGAGNGSRKSPGEFRRSLVWIGGTRPGNSVFVPPPADKVLECLGEFERFLNDDSAALPLLAKAAVGHVQFETIHPFLDGNGRVGRLLITLQLCVEGMLHEPLLYPSLYFKKHRAEYYRLLNKVRIDGDWESWVEFFVEGIAESATDAATTAKRLLDLCTADALRISKLGRPAGSALAVHQVLQRRPIVTAGYLCDETGLSAATVNKALVQLERIGVVRELTQRRRGRVFCYQAYADVLGEEMELPG